MNIQTPWPEVISFLQYNSEPIPESGCWIWECRVRGPGYAYFTNDDYLLAHQFLARKKCGSVECGRHLCGIRLCVNPSHITGGTQKQNAADRKIHGTNNSGERCGQSILTREQVNEIRSIEVFTWEDAVRIGVSVQNARRIRARTRWKTEDGL